MLDLDLGVTNGLYLFRELFMRHLGTYSKLMAYFTQRKCLMTLRGQKSYISHNIHYSFITLLLSLNAIKSNVFE